MQHQKVFLQPPERPTEGSPLKRISQPAALTCYFAILFVALLTNTFAQESGDDALALQLRADVVRVSARTSSGLSPQNGFGFIVGQQGQQLIVVTANHVVRGDSPGEEDLHPMITFFENQGSSVSGVLQNTSLAQDHGDLAVIVVTLPSTYSWKPPRISGESLSRGTKVWLIGQEGKWDVPTIPGVVSDVLPDGTIEVERLEGRKGSSGGPLVSENGIVGMIVAVTDLKTIAEPIALIRGQVRDQWRYTWMNEGLPIYGLVDDALFGLWTTEIVCPKTENGSSEERSIEVNISRNRGNRVQPSTNGNAVQASFSLWDLVATHRGDLNVTMNNRMFINCTVEMTPESGHQFHLKWDGQNSQCGEQGYEDYSRSMALDLELSEDGSVLKGTQVQGHIPCSRSGAQLKFKKGHGIVLGTN
jgi:hypothetical protein